jgi:hypothetical protein
MGKVLEAVTYRKLHDSRLGQRTGIGAERGGGLFQLSCILRQRRHVASNCVGQVGHFERSHPLAGHPTFREYS